VPKDFKLNLVKSPQVPSQRAGHRIYNTKRLHKSTKEQEDDDFMKLQKKSIALLKMTAGLAKKKSNT
jgi:hypothetical protein